MRIKNLALLFIFLLQVMACAATSEKRTFGQVVDDEVIALSLRTKFMKDRSVPAKEILISVWKGVVTLKGEMNDQDQINRAIEISERQRGVKEVKAHLVLKEFGQLREDSSRRERKPLFQGLFKRGRNRTPKDELQEKNLDEDGIKSPDTSRATAKSDSPDAPLKALPAIDEMGDIEAEEDF